MKHLKRIVNDLKIKYSLKPYKRTNLTTGITVDIYRNGTIDVIEINNTKLK
jgi:hypothetical protein